MSEHDDSTDFDLGDLDDLALDDGDDLTAGVLEDETDDIEDHTDFDAFWRKQTKAKKDPATATICGVMVTLPRALPVQYQLEVARQAKLKQDKQNPLTLATILLGEQQVKQLLRAGLDYDQFSILLAWIPAKLQGSNMTLEEVAAELEEFERKRAEKLAQGDDSGEA